MLYRGCWLGLTWVGWMVGSACVSSGTHALCLKDLADTKTLLQSVKDGAAAEHEQQLAKQHELENKLTASMASNSTLASKLTSLGTDVAHLLGEKDDLAKERIALQAELTELRRLRDQGEARMAEYRQLLAKLHNMIDAGTLQVVIRNGRMVVQMSSDVLFPPGGTKLKADAVAAIVDLAGILKGFPERKFQIVGHSDATPIHTARFPSNWELSAERAIEVTKMLIQSGVPADMLSAAGQGEFDPLQPNTSEAQKKLNRRVEVIFMPKIDELPGFAEVMQEKQASVSTLPIPG